MSEESLPGQPAGEEHEGFPEHELGDEHEGVVVARA